MLANIKKLFKRHAPHPLAGKRVYCPCCKNSFITFLPHGLEIRANARCPQCNSLERHRLVWHYLTEEKNILSMPDTQLLHVAPEKVFYDIFMSVKAIKYTPIDKFTEGYSYPAGTINMDITDLKFPENSFDIILCNHVLEHVPDDSKAISELHRVLKPNGFAILQVPINPKIDSTYEDFTITDPKEREKHFGQFDHVRVYGRDYKNRLEKGGFKVNVIEYLKRFTWNEKFRLGFMIEEGIYECHKF